MGKPLAITASLVDVRNIAAHKCVRLEIHVPVEQAGEVMGAFGWPTMVDPVPVALARLDLSAAKQQAREDGPDTRGVLNVGLEHIEYEQEQKTRRKMTDLPIAQRAALICQREAFWNFLKRKYDINWSIAMNSEESLPSNEDVAKFSIYDLCGIKSRSDLSCDDEAARTFCGIELEFNAWLTEPL